MFCGKYIQKIATLESELKDSGALQRALDRSTAVIELAVDGKIIGANENFCGVMGYSPAELAGQNHRLLCDEAFASNPEYAQFWARLRGGEFFRGTIKRRHKNGRDVWLEATYNPVLDERGLVQKIVKLAAEVTQQVEEASRMRAMV